MANILATQNGNWSSGSTWVGGTPPGSGDTAVANNKTITIDANATCAEVRNDTTGGATAGGYFTLADGVTLTANISVTDAGVRFSANAPAVAYVVGNVTVSSGITGNVSGALKNTATGTLTLTGNSTGGSGGTNSSTGLSCAACNASTGTMSQTGTSTGASGGSGCAASNNAAGGTYNLIGNATGGSAGVSTYALYNHSTGTFNVTGNVYGGTGTSQAARGVVNNASGSVYITGSVYGGSTSSYAEGALNNSNGTIEITLDVIGGSAGTNSHGVYNYTSGTITIQRDALGGAGINSHGVYNNSTGTVTTQRDAIGGAGTNSCGVYNNNIGTVTIQRDAIGGAGSASYGGYNNSTGIMNVYGLAISNNYPNDSIVYAVPGIYNTNASGIVRVGGIKFGTGGIVPLAGSSIAVSRFFFMTGGVKEAYMYDANQGNLINLNSTTVDPPAVGNVRYGVSYYNGSMTGTCRVPGASSVLAGVPIDNTVGTATLSAADIRAAVGLASANLDTQLAEKASAQNVWEYTTRTITSGGVLAEEIWEYESRELTDKTEFELTSAYDAAKTAATQSSVNAIPTAPLLADDYVAPDNAGISAIQQAIEALPAPDNAGISAIQQALDGVASDVLSAAVESGVTVVQALRILLAVLAGKVSGAGTSQIAFRDVNDSKDRVVATVDQFGNRSTLVLNKD